MRRTNILLAIVSALFLAACMSDEEYARQQLKNDRGTSGNEPAMVRDFVDTLRINDSLRINVCYIGHSGRSSCVNLQ